MQAIEVRVLPATGRLKTRYKAVADGERLTYQADATRDAAANARAAAEELARMLGWEVRLACGRLREGWVFVPVSVEVSA